MSRGLCAGAEFSLEVQTPLPACSEHGNNQFHRESKEKVSFAENTSNASPVPSAKYKRRDNFMASSLHKTSKLRSGEALFYKDNSVPLCSRNNPAVSILSQSLLQTTLITTQSTLKALAPCKGQSGPQCKSFCTEEIFHPCHTGLHRVNHTPQDDFGGSASTD